MSILNVLEITNACDGSEHVTKRLTAADELGIVLDPAEEGVEL